jgi:peptidoglycan-N-acetylglucosamine deacetylase
MPFPRRAWAAAATLAAVAGMSAAAVTVAAPPSGAATCNGYVGLTFDDGPTPGNTQNLLNALRSAGLRATMFNEGQNAQPNPSLVQAQVSAGMWVGNHSWDHPHMTQLSTAQMTSEIQRTQQALQQITGTAPRLFRPPYGETNSTLRSVEAQFGLTEIVWDVDSQDWNGASTAQIVQAVGRLTAGQVILMHDWPANTVAAIPQIASNLASRNLCAGMISPSTGRAVAPDGSNPAPSSTPPSTPSTSGPPPTGSACRVSSSVSAWNNGLTNNMTITNAGYNSTIAANASVGIGYQATHTGNTAAPTGFALNGVTCATG